MAGPHRPSARHHRYRLLDQHQHPCLPGSRRVNLQELLNSEMDLSSLAALARQGLGWWLDELVALLPPAWRARLSSRPRVLAEQITPGVWRYWKDGRTVDRAP